MPAEARARARVKADHMLVVMAKGSSYTCPECGEPTDYNQEFDAYFCARCDVYSEKACSDLACQFCSKRPELPSEMT